MRSRFGVDSRGFTLERESHRIWSAIEKSRFIFPLPAASASAGVGAAEMARRAASIFC
jgi:hypothetical protein